jgi:hypothetical protein
MICEECGRKLGFVKGYKHPTLGRGHCLCSPCFDQVSESVAKWREFVLSNTFNIKSYDNNSSINLKKLVSTFLKKFNEIDAIWFKKIMYLER